MGPQAPCSFFLRAPTVFGCQFLLHPEAFSLPCLPSELAYCAEHMLCSSAQLILGWKTLTCWGNRCLRLSLSSQRGAGVRNSNGIQLRSLIGASLEVVVRVLARLSTPRRPDGAAGSTSRTAPSLPVGRRPSHGRDSRVHIAWQPACPQNWFEGPHAIVSTIPIPSWLHRSASFSGGRDRLGGPNIPHL